MIANSSSGSGGHMTSRRDPSDQRRESAGGSADDDVLRRPRLQPDGVDQHVEEDRRGKQHGREPVGRETHQKHREESRGRPRSATPIGGSIRPAGSGRLAVRRIFASMSASYHWLSAPQAPAPSAMHRIAVKPSTNGSCTGATSKPHRPVKTTRLHHARLGQREKVAPVGRQRGRVGHLQGGHGAPIRVGPERKTPLPPARRVWLILRDA